MKEIRNFFGEIVGDILEEDRQRAEEGLSGSTPHQLSA
jgi:hypothetical protein